MADIFEAAGPPVPPVPRPEQAVVPRGTQHLTSELLGWLYNALEAVLKTPEAKAEPVAYRALIEALKKLDILQGRAL